MMQTYQLQTEEELLQEIGALMRLIEVPAEPGKASARCARSFLKQMLKDKQAALSALRQESRGTPARPSVPVQPVHRSRGWH